IEEVVLEIGNRSLLKPGGTSTLAGYVRDKETGEPLIGALVYLPDPFHASSTDIDGFFSLKLPNGKSTILIQYSGMKNTRRNIVMFSNGRLDIEMELDVIALQEVTIESMRDANIQDVQMGVNRISVAETKNVPLALGERDIIKIATTFAGVQSPGEGAAGFNVRGGKSDQNLVLLNDATIYNASHFLGFFSVFNSDAIENMEIYKSGIPVIFGGRLSSVFDIESKSASKKKFSGMGGISPITSMLTLEIPVIEYKAGLMVSGRTTYSNWLLKNVKNADFSENRVAFKDLLVRYDHDLTDKDEMVLSMYMSDDDFRLTSDTLFSFSNFGFFNANGSAKWTHTFSNRLDASLSAIYSAYRYELNYDVSPPNAFVQDFDINEATIKGAVGHYIDDVNTLTAGVEIKKYQINPGTKTPLSGESIVTSRFINEEQGLESALYLSDEYNVNKELT
ncbi:MAG: carboxypeptidase-like regulatory domain-containing protein, partial [Marinoscillum sp.]